MPVWFEVGWAVATAKNGLSAVQLQSDYSLGSYETAWTMLHRYRRATVFAERSKLAGYVEADEAYYGGRRAGKKGRSAVRGANTGIGWSAGPNALACEASSVLLSFLYRAFLALLRLATRRDTGAAAREAELLVLRHEFAVLRRSQPRPLRWSDRTYLPAP